MSPGGRSESAEQINYLSAAAHYDSKSEALFHYLKSHIRTGIFHRALCRSHRKIGFGFGVGKYRAPRRRYLPAGFKNESYTGRNRRDGHAHMETGQEGTRTSHSTR